MPVLITERLIFFACEAFQLTDLPAAHPFSSFISYHGMNDFKEKAAFYINHPEERQKVIAAQL